VVATTKEIDMKSTRTPKYVLAGVVGLLGLGIGATLAPGAAVAATSTTAAVSDRVTEIKDALSGLVSDKTLTQAQADEVATTLDDKLPQGGFGRGGHGGGDLDAAATVIGVTADELRTALQGGQTLAQVAQGKGIDQATLVSKLVAAEKAEIAADVKAGNLTQAQADSRTADLQSRITAQVTSTRPAGGHGRGDGSAPSASPSTGGSSTTS
jgi:hypothetical protein